MVVQFRVPAPSSTALLNLLGVLGVLSIVVAIGVLTSWPWGLMAFGVVAVAFTVLAQTSADAPARPAAVTGIETARKAKAAA